MVVRRDRDVEVEEREATTGVEVAVGVSRAVPWVREECPHSLKSCFVVLHIHHLHAVYILASTGPLSPLETAQLIYSSLFVVPDDLVP